MKDVVYIVKGKLKLGWQVSDTSVIAVYYDGDAAMERKTDLENVYDEVWVAATQVEDSDNTFPTDENDIFRTEY